MRRGQNARVTENDVISHYGSTDLGRDLLAALDGAFGSAFDATALRSVDQFHLGGHLATQALLDGLDLSPGDAVLDVGCGIGGVARDIASRFSCSVTAIDLTPSFVDAARQLSDRVGVGDAIVFETGDALALPYDARTFDAAVVVHVGMNIDDKGSLMGELRRVSKPAATVVIYDIVRLTADPLDYPVPWASDSAMDFVRPEQAYLDAAAQAGLGHVRSVDRTDLVYDAIERAAANPAPVNLANLMGSAWPTMFGHLVAALRAGTLAPVEMTFTTP